MRAVQFLVSHLLDIVIQRPYIKFHLLKDHLNLPLYNNIVSLFIEFNCEKGELIYN